MGIAQVLQHVRRGQCRTQLHYLTVLLHVHCTLLDLAAKHAKDTWAACAPSGSAARPALAAGDFAVDHIMMKGAVGMLPMPKGKDLHRRGDADS